MFISFSQLDFDIAFFFPKCFFGNKHHGKKMKGTNIELKCVVDDAIVVLHVYIEGGFAMGGLINCIFSP